METLLVSACLMGVRCRYDGGGSPAPGIERLKERYQLIPVCPEIMGGLPTPRPPAERREGKVVTREGGDVTAAFIRGAEEAVALARFFGCRKALLKARSPSCGAGMIYDGSFTRRLVPGNGVLADALLSGGVEVYGEPEVERLLETKD